MPMLRVSEAVNIDGVDWPAGEYAVDDPYWSRALVARGAEELVDTTPMLTRIVPDAAPAAFSTADVAGHINEVRARAKELGVSAGGSRDDILARIAAKEAELAAEAAAAATAPDEVDPNAPETIEAVAKLLGIDVADVPTLDPAAYAEAVAKLTEAAAASA